MPKEVTHSELSNGHCTTNVVHTTGEGTPIKVDVYSSHVDQLTGSIHTDTLKDSYTPSKRR